MHRHDSPHKRQRQANLFEAIKRTQQLRDEAEKQANPPAPPKPLIETHGLNSAGQRLPTAMEMSLHKAQRDRQMAQALLEQRQLSAAISLGSQAPSVSIYSIYIYIYICNSVFIFLFRPRHVLLPLFLLLLPLLPQHQLNLL
jgi:hypothetical protein